MVPNSTRIATTMIANRKAESKAAWRRLSLPSTRGEGARNQRQSLRVVVRAEEGLLISVYSTSRRLNLSNHTTLVFFPPVLSMTIMLVWQIVRLMFFEAVALPQTS